MTRITIPTEPAEAAAALLAYLDRPDYRPMPQRELLHRTHVPRAERPAVRRVIRQLLEQGKIRLIRGGRLVRVPEQREVRGVLERRSGSHARLRRGDGSEEVLIAARHLGEARPGEQVAVRVLSRGADGRLRGVVTRVLRDESGIRLGIFRERPRGGEVLPLDPALGAEIHVPAVYRGDASDMHAVLFEIARGRRTTPSREARVLESLGHLDAPGTDTLVVARKYGLPLEFPPAVLEAARGLPGKIDRRAAAGRERFDDPAPVTIDGETARDFDDAVAVAELPGGGFRLWVHIADVAHFVEPGDTLDVEARRRATSVYFPDRVLPMFPEQLSNELCSLKPGQDRLVQTVVLDLTSKGKPSKVRFADGVIRSAARLTYTQVAAVLDGDRKSSKVPRRLIPMLEAAERLRQVLDRRRHARGSVDFDLPQPQILLDVEGAMTGITIEPRNRAHLMIEEFMLLANEVVAGHLESRQSGCLYRVHDPPAPEKAEALRSFVAGFGLELDTSGGELAPGAIQRLMDAVEGRPESRVIGQVALRSMMQARYSPNNSGHFGLAAPVYCHFTSPIRRYPDLVVHRQLRKTRGGSHGESQRDELEGIAEHSSERERNAEAAERELLAWKKVAYIEDKVGECFDGLITGVTRFGLFVQLVDNLVEGLVRIELLGQEWFEYDEGGFQLIGADSGRVYRLGDRLRVRVDRVNRLLQRVDLSPDGAEPPPARPRRAPGPRRRGKPSDRTPPARRQGRRRR